jgi:hypothetical protein
VFSDGAAGFHGSRGGTPLDAPVVSMTSDPVTGGYWLAAADGGVFSFAAPFYGSRAGQRGPDNFVAMCSTAGAAGYLLVGQHPA